VALDAYESFYRDFDSPLMRQMRREAYGEDIGQHSWVTADELRLDIDRLALSRTSRLLDLGCGPCGPLTFILARVGCRGTGVEQSSAALRVGQARALAVGVEAAFSATEANLDEPLPFGDASFDAAISLDVVLHLRDREHLFREVARVLRPGGRFLVTDAGVVTGAVSNEEVEARSVYGYTQFVAPGWNEHRLESAGLRLLATENRTASAVTNAGGRLATVRAHRAALERATSAVYVERQERYLEVVVELARRGAVSRLMYLAEPR
jgi:SAM-dependent methyltransferase